MKKEWNRGILTGIVNTGVNHAKPHTMVAAVFLISDTARNDPWQRNRGRCQSPPPLCCNPTGAAAD
jgi:hypothetical protein